MIDDRTLSSVFAPNVLHGPFGRSRMLPQVPKAAAVSPTVVEVGCGLTGLQPSCALVLDRFA